MNFIKELGIPFLGFLIFFVFESRGRWSEKILTSFIVFLVILTAAITYNHNEWILFLIGLIFGVVIEVGMRYFGYQQKWKDASFFGVPYWLPIIWGFGFVIIARLGLFVLGL
jgi:hypothetical protein